VTEAVFHYVAGNLITSLFAAAFVFVSLTLLNVPAAFLLAVLAGVCDFVPILGFFVALTPAVLLALTISPGTALAVVGLYGLCHAIENYAIVPKVCGHHLKLSGVAVLLGLGIGAALGGIIGALLALPVVSAYPIVERNTELTRKGHGRNKEKDREKADYRSLRNCFSVRLASLTIPPMV